MAIMAEQIENAFLFHVHNEISKGEGFSLVKSEQSYVSMSSVFRESGSWIITRQDMFVSVLLMRILHINESYFILKM